jgi:prepilin-type N-terminal cleavage/methylation domain-containing protein
LTPRRQPRARLGGEGGFTIVEVLVAAAILALALTGLAHTFDTSRQLTAKSESESEATGIAQREIETALGLSYADTRPTDVAGGPGWTSTAATIGVDTSAEVSSGSTGVARTGTWTGRAGSSGSVYRYVTWAPGTNQALKRITVAVTATALGKPVVLSVYVQDPQVGPGGFTGGQTPCAPGRATCNP